MSTKTSIKEILLHILMIIYSCTYLRLFFNSSLEDNVMLFYASLFYQCYFFLSIAKKDTNTVFYGVICFLIIYWFHYAAFPDDSWVYFVMLLEFPAWPIIAASIYLAIPRYFGFVVPWKMMYYIYLFIIITCWSIRILRMEKTKEYIKIHIKGRIKGDYHEQKDKR